MNGGMVVFGEDWGRHPSSTQHLIRRLAADSPVLWVNSIGLRRPQLTVRDLKRAAGKLFGCTRSAQSDGSVSGTLPTPDGRAPTSKPANLTVASPLVVPWPGSRLAYAANRALLGSQLRPMLAARGISRPILWTSLPTALPALGHLGERAVVYYCGDDFGALAGVDHAPVLAMEQALVAKADLIFAASETLAARFPPSKTLLVPHGADITLFSNSVPPAPDLPRDRPVAGFYGSLADWIDVELLAAVAQALPDWQFVFIGAIETDVGLLRGCPNVTLLGPRAHHALPAYAQHWQASLLPFRDCAQIRACNPLKLREYLAAGRPVISTPFPALSGYRDVVCVVDGRDAFVAALRSTLTRPDRTSEQRARVSLETWEARAADVSRALEAL
jgi:glycosyltransferase involved in cell wall biosynthesis